MWNHIINWYLTIALMIFCFWTIVFFQDNTTPKDHQLSWLILLTAPLFWPIVLPICSWELTTKALNNQNNQFSRSKRTNYNHW